MKRYKEMKTDEGKRLQGFTDGAARIYQIKLKSKLLSIGKEIRNTDDLSAKIDLLSKQQQVTGALIIIASNVGASGVISKVGILSSLITEKEVEECLSL